MSFNAVTQRLGMDPISQNSLIDILGQESPLPEDVILNIFEKLKTDLPHLALVSKTWKAMADDKRLYDRIRPRQAFGTKEWKEYIGVDAGEELRLPRRVYGDLEKGAHLLTFIPEKIKVTKENGKVEEVALDNLKDIGDLVKTPITVLETGYSKAFTTRITLPKIRVNQEESHWVWINKEVLGRNKTYFYMEELIESEKIKIPGADYSGILDTVISMFMEYARSGERNFSTLPIDNNLSTLIFLRESFYSPYNNFVSGFGPSGIVFTTWTGPHISVGFVVARKFFGD